MSKSVGAIVYDTKNRIRSGILRSRFKSSISKVPPIIVYQMGKVGSSSIYSSLKQHYSGVIIHSHFLTGKADWQGKMLIDHAVIDKGPLKLISLVRDPLARNVSALFQNFELITGVKPEMSKFSTEEIKNIMLTSPNMDHKVPLWWFERNTKAIFGIDVYAHTFDKEKGWIILQNGNTQLLLMKAEIGDEIKTTLIRNFLDLPKFKLSAFNVSEDKDYASMYKAFKNDARLPDDYIDMLYKASQVKHFYSDEEIEKFSKKWKR